MSIRTLIEINHDYTHDLDDPAFVRLFQRYLATGDQRWGDELRHWGLRIISQRHHSADFHFDPANVDGFGQLAHPKERDHD